MFVMALTNVYSHVCGISIFTPISGACLDGSRASYQLQKMGERRQWSMTSCGAQPFHIPGLSALWRKGASWSLPAHGIQIN